VAVRPKLALTPKNNSDQTGDAPADKADKKAQRQAASEDVLLREVDDAVRQDQYASFASTYGKLLIAVLVLGLGGFGGYLYWDGQREAGMEVHSETLVAALDQVEAGNLATASTTLDPLLTEGEGGVQASARMLKAGIALEQGNKDEAVKLFAQIAADDSAPAALREIATIRQIATDFDAIKPEDVIARLKPLAVPGEPFFGSAGELVAMAYLELGKNAEAGTLFATMAKNEKVPEGLRSRSRQMAGLLGVDAVEDVDKVLEEMASAENAAAPITR